jgi:hypothetical protein
MTVNFTKGKFNLREKLKELERPSVDKLVTKDENGAYIDTIRGTTKLESIDSVISDTAVDIFIYDTSKDSDGGAWRKRTQQTSWYNEELNTATRGSRRDFPAVAVIVAEGTKLTIYDGDDPDLPMWMVFNQGGSYIASNNLIGTTAASNSAITCLNGILSLTTSTEAIYLIKFISDRTQRITNSANREYLGGIGERNSGKGLSASNSTNYIVNANCNDVAMTVLPNAPIDSATGLPVPTIVVATEAGISIIKDNESVVDINSDGSVGAGVDSVSFYNNSQFIAAWDTVGTGSRNTYSYDIPSGDISASSYLARYVDSTTGGGNFLYYSSGASRIFMVQGLKGHPRNRFVLQGTFTDDCITLIDEDQNTSGGADGMVAYITPDYNTGWLHARNRAVWFSSTSTTDAVTTEDDRSANNKNLSITGSLTRNPVNTGTDLVAYSGFSSSNYLYNTSMNPPGTSNFALTFWIRPNTIDVGSGNYMHLFSLGTDILGGQGRSTGFTLKMTTHTGGSSAGYVPYFFNGSGGGDEGTYNANNYFPLGVWTHCVAMRKGGIPYLYFNGRLVQTGNSWTSNITDQYLTVGIGIDYAEYGGDADVALLRYEIGGMPTDDEIKQMYEDEKQLFLPYAQSTVYGTSYDITDMSYDEKQDILHVGTSAGRSEFQGLRRINNTTTAVTTAISAYDSFVVEQ